MFGDIDGQCGLAHGRARRQHDQIAGLQATGQIDIRTDLTVTFIGDKRVLADVDALARHGYGEDAFGNNVLLPRELSYLRR